MATKGRWDASVRCAYQLCVAEGLGDAASGDSIIGTGAVNTAPTPEWCQAMGRRFEKYLSARHNDLADISSSATAASKGGPKARAISQQPTGDESVASVLMQRIVAIVTNDAMERVDDWGTDQEVMSRANMRFFDWKITTCVEN